MLNFLTLDIEEWYHANYEGFGPIANAVAQTNLEVLVDRLIELFAERGVKTTAFILASVAERKPAVVKKLAAAGHEIACHGYFHELVYRIGPERFAADLERATKILSDITGERPVGFRAPSFSVRREMLGWFYDTLEQAGFAYSSSIFPGRTFLYGVPGFPPAPHRPEVDGRRRMLVEFPVPVVKLAGKQMGLYLRLFSAGMIRRRIERDNRVGRPVVLYVHPREIDPDQPRLPLPPLQRLIHYWGIRGTEPKLRRLLAEGCFGRMGDWVAEQEQGLSWRIRPLPDGRGSETEPRA